MSARDPQISLTPEDIDRLGQAFLSLTREVWVLKDRLRVLEAVLRDAGLLVPGAVDSYQPDPELEDMLCEERRRLIEQVLGPLGAGDG